MRKLALFFVSFFLVFFSVAVYATVSLPAIGQDSDYLLNKENEIGRQFRQQLKKNNQIIDDPLVSFYINEVVLTLLQSLDDNKRTYQIDIINDDAINAFAVPGGFIGIYTGLIFVAETETQLAGVLSHEIAHIDLQHIYQLLQKRDDVNNTMLASYFLALLLSNSDSDSSAEAIEALVFGATASGHQSLINFTRENEYEADRAGLRIMKRAGYPPVGMAEFFALLGEGEAGEISTIEYLRTHPISSNRMGEAYQFNQKNDISSQAKSDDFEFFKLYLSFQTKGFYQSANEDNTIRYYQLALSHMRNNKFIDAEDLLHKLHRGYPENIWFVSSLISLKLQQNNYAEAYELLQHALQIYPQRSFLLKLKIEILVLLRETEKALALALEELSKGKYDVLYLLVQIYDQLEKPLKAREFEAEYHYVKRNYDRSMHLYDFVIHATKDVNLKKLLESKKLKVLKSKNQQKNNMVPR